MSDLKSIGDEYRRERDRILRSADDILQVSLQRHAQRAFRRTILLSAIMVLLGLVSIAFIIYCKR